MVLLERIATKGHTSMWNTNQGKQAPKLTGHNRSKKKCKSLAQTP